MKQKQEKLETKMKWMLLSTMIPMTILIIVLLVFFWHYTNEYNQLSNNLAVSSEYNANYRNSNNDMSFKDEVDMDIYYVTIGRKWIRTAADRAGRQGNQYCGESEENHIKEGKPAFSEISD